ncbi:MAG: bifunctional 5,10-methylenetetrahydrofolate dehydrogenase/5,10-methenyltetrahydrofolate cyclohydrolase [Oscillospiraceae bacterium]
MCQDKIISGKIISQKIRDEIKQDVEKLKANNVTPKLSVIVVGENPASQTYVRGKVKDCAECGIESDTISLSGQATQKEVISVIKRLNEDVTVHGILVQLPFPEQIDEYAVVNTISPSKDVDGVTALNVGNLYLGKDCFVPCTAQGCLDVLEYADIEVAGKNVVVVGRSNIVGKPVGALLMQRDATVTICHTKTKNLIEKTKAADIIIMTIGRAGFLTGDMIKPDAVIVDVGINVNSQGKLCGDVDFESCIDKVSRITPVPGGIGLMTRANLLRNTVKSAKNVCYLKQEQSEE